jgi:uncharacterized membrane protein
MGQFDIAREVWQFLKLRKKVWLIPLVMVLVALGVVIALSAGGAVAPFIYALF